MHSFMRTCTNITKKNIIVFLGPSLALDVAKQLLPSAMFLPPVSCGDILRVIRLKPDIIIIIDGLFENQPAVWHKEILYAMSLGVAVFGASSMGALRASELASLGMHVFGDIALQYSTGELNDDDEVALLHGNASMHFAVNSDPMINIRATLKLALQENIIDVYLHDKLITYTKAMYYPERSLRHAISALIVDHASPTLINLSQWLETHGLVDVKQQDAMALLQYVASLTTTSDLFTEFNTPSSTALQDLSIPPTAPRDLFAGSINIKTPNFHFNASNLFRGLRKSINCRPFNKDYSWLPIDERVALHSRYLDDYPLIRQLAYLLSACYQLALDNPCNSRLSLSELCDKLGLNSSILNEYAQEKMLTILSFIYHYYPDKNDLQKYFLLFMKANKIYISYKEKTSFHEPNLLLQHFQQTKPISYQLYYLIALCWHVIHIKIATLAITPNIQALQNYADNFRKRHELFSISSLQCWLSTHDLDASGFEAMMLSLFHLNYFVMQNQLDLLLSRLYDDEHGWFMDALTLSGYYPIAEHLLNDNEALIKAKASLLAQAKDDDFWFARDLEIPENSA